MNTKPFLLFVILLLLPFLIGCPAKKEERELNNAVTAGNQAMVARDWNQAIAQFTRGLERNAGNNDLLYSLAAAYLAKARDHYNLAVAAAGRGDMMTAEEEAKMADDHFDLAQKQVTSLLANDSKFADAYYLRGCIQLYQGDWNAAIESFSESIKLNPNSPFAWQRRGEVYGYTGDNANEIVDLNKAAQLGYIDTNRLVKGKEESVNH